MQTFLPYEDFDETARVLDLTRLNSQLNETIVILRSNLGVYEPNKRTGVIGWSAHPAARMWKGRELNLVKYGQALAREFLRRPLSKYNPDGSLLARRNRLAKFNALYKEFEARGFVDQPMPLLGDEEFHSAFRALLLYKDLQAETFKKFKKGEYPDHLTTRHLPRKASWKPAQYEAIWEFFGKPPHGWYGQWGWTEEPNPDLVFYDTSREPYIVYRKRRKKEAPTQPWLRPRK